MEKKKPFSIMRRAKPQMGMASPKPGRMASEGGGILWEIPKNRLKEHQKA